MTAHDAASRARAVLARLDSLELAGLTHLPRPSGRGGPAAAEGPPAGTEGAAASPAQRASSPAAAAPAAEPSRAAPVLRAADSGAAAGRRMAAESRSLFDAPAEPPEQALDPQRREALLAELARQVAGCTRCAELCASRTQTVFGVGNPACRIAFIGEAPGADEDRQGEPFVGRAGQLLNKIIEACGLRRADVYIANVLKCRPPNNRTPLPAEVANCRAYLDAQLEIIRPQILCCLGAVAAQTLLESTLSLGKLRGRRHQYRAIPVVVTYHPAYLLRNPAAKKDTWEDMKFLLREVGLSVPG